MKNKIKSIAVLAAVCATVTTAQAQTNQLLNLPLPEDGFRYHSYEELEFQWPASHGEGSVCLWGDDKFAAVSLTIDDNIPGDWSFWRQVSADYGWKITWFVIVHPYIWDVYNDVIGSNTGGFGTTENFKTLYEEGHDIQLHGNTDMNALTDPEYGDQMVRARAHMESVISNKMAFFAYPGGTPDAGIPEGVDRVAVARQLVSAARGGQGYGIAKPATLDYVAVPTIGPALDTSASGYWIKMEEKPTNLKYSSYRGWAVLLNHTVQDKPAALVLFDYIKTNEFKYWVKPFSHVACYGQERDSSTLNVTTVTADRIVFELTDLMKDDIFNVPLTVKFRVDGWGGASASQNGQPIPVSLMVYSNNTYALVDAVPDQGTVTLTKADSAGFTAVPVSGWVPLTVTFTDTSTYSGITNRFWDFGDGTATNTAGTGVTHTYTSAGTCTVQLVVSSPDGVYTNTQLNLISAATPVAPSAGFSVSPSAGAAPLPVTFTDTSTGTITNRFWDFGDGAVTNTIATNVTHTYTAAGTSTVQLIVSGPAGVSTNTQTAAVTVTLPVAPSAAFSASPTSGAASLAVAFTDTSTGSITNRFWNFGDGGTTNTIAMNVTHTYTAAGTYTVQLTVSGPAGVSTNTQPDLIGVTAPPQTALLFYDDFSSAAGSLLGTMPDTGLTAWNYKTNSPAGDAYKVIEAGLTAPAGFAAAGGGTAAKLATGNDSYSTFTAVPAVAGNAVFYSFLFSATSTVASASAGGKIVGLGTAYGADYAQTRYQKVANDNFFTLGLTVRSTTGTYMLTNRLALGSTHLIVMSYTYVTGTTNDLISMWLDPDSSTFGAGSAPPADLTVATLTSDSGAIDSVRLGGLSTIPNAVMTDELRIGTNWAGVTPPAVSAPAGDADSDGLPDEWEEQYFSGSTNANPDAIAANGINTIYEAYIAGLNPTDAQSVFALSNPQSASLRVLQWSAVSGRVYSVHWATNLLNGFQSLATNILWPQNSWTDEVHGAEAGGFYRLKVELDR